MIKAVIADDIQILRQGLRAILEQDKDIRVVGLAADGREAWQLCRKHRPDVVLMDMRMPEYDGSYGITRIKEDYPDIKVLVLTTFDDRETVDAAVGSGADGYILKEMEDDKVIQSVKAVCAGIRVFGGSVFEGMRRQMASGKTKADMAGDLTPNGISCGWLPGEWTTGRLRGRYSWQRGRCATTSPVCWKSLS